ncbi:MAG: oxygen-dependent coproporphyrinogen oxidase [Sphingobacteriales bacterium]|nr:MAG: oxygen-dependent coproporphyrinogen oxidase [Sphingobacteriales bacterium]
MSSIRDIWTSKIHDLQNKICTAVEEEDGGAVFHEDVWERAEGGGGKTRVISGGHVFEKGGVNSSVVFGEVTPMMTAQLKIQGHQWFACGVSLVLHPLNPFVPTVHCNYRMFELYDEAGNVVDRWFGGGTDLTPYYLFEEDARHFHRTYKKVCDKYDASYFARFKTQCDEYFVNSHRNKERRGIGGIFYDYCRVDADHDVNHWMNFGMDCGHAFTDAYLPIVQKRKNLPFTASHKYWQEIRRGRYTEFNLVHDRGTLFGLKTNGRIESILMSLPPTVRFDYNYQPTPCSPEDELLQACLHPRDWV